ncbi:MAG: adenine phosphoribosyltransferase [Alphaproteobacteria bacterium]
MNIRDYIRIVPGFPKAGINFYDIATLIAAPEAWHAAIAQLAEKIAPYKPDRLMGIEARGFLVASALALHMGLPLGMIRKKGKLPGQTLTYKYDLEYGSDEIQIQPDLITKGARIALIDDLLATGGTLAAAADLIAKAGAEVVAAFCIIELDGLGGHRRLPCPFESLLLCPA